MGNNSQSFLKELKKVVVFQDKGPKLGCNQLGNNGNFNSIGPLKSA